MARIVNVVLVGLLRRRFVPGLSMPPAQYDDLVAAIRGLDAAPSVDPVLRLLVARRERRLRRSAARVRPPLFLDRPCLG